MAERTLDWTWLWHSTSWASLPVPWTPSPRGRRILFCPHEGLLGLVQAMQVKPPRHPLHCASQTCVQVTCGEPFWTQLSNPKHESGVRLKGSMVLATTYEAPP